MERKFPQAPGECVFLCHSQTSVITSKSEHYIQSNDLFCPLEKWSSMDFISFLPYSTSSVPNKRRHVYCFWWNLFEPTCLLRIRVYSQRCLFVRMRESPWDSLRPVRMSPVATCTSPMKMMPREKITKNT